MSYKKNISNITKKNRKDLELFRCLFPFNFVLQFLLSKSTTKLTNELKIIHM